MQVGLIEKRGHDMRVQLLQMCIWSSARGRNGAARVWIIQKACRECPGSPCVTCHWSYLITIIEGHCHPPHCRHFSHLIRIFFPFIMPDDFLLMVMKWLWYLTLGYVWMEWSKWMAHAQELKWYDMQSVCHHTLDSLHSKITSCNVCRSIIQREWYKICLCWWVDCCFQWRTMPISQFLKGGDKKQCWGYLFHRAK
jgi:hypothetical protein